MGPGEPSPSIVVVGNVSAAPFHKAKAVLEAVKAQLGALSVTALLPFEYDAELERLKRGLASHPFGAHVWTHSAPVAVYSDTAGWIGDEVALLKYLPRCGISANTPALNSLGCSSSWEELAQAAFSAHLVSTGLTYVYLDFESNGDDLGRLVFELFSDRLPRTTANFAALCDGGKGSSSSGVQLHYKGSLVHRIVKGGWLQGGDIEFGTGVGGVPALGEPLPDENFCVLHDAPGLLGMANTGPHTATSQFYITTAPLRSFDRKFVAFGRLVDGTKLLEYLSKLSTTNERPKNDLKISSCGVIEAVEVAQADPDAAATKLQAIRRGQQARKKQRRGRKKEDTAATHVQARIRGRAVRQESQRTRFVSM